MIPYKLQWLKLQQSDWRAREFIRDHVTFKLPYDFSYHMKTPQMRLILILYQIHLIMQVQKVEFF